MLAWAGSGARLCPWSAGALLAALPAAWVSRAILAGYLDRAPPPRVALTAATLVVFGSAALVAPPPAILVSSLVLGTVLLCLAIVDSALYRLPDALTLPLLIGGLGVTALLPRHPFLDHLAGAALGWGVLAGLAAAWRRLRGVEAIGLGDAKLLGAAGAWLGWAPLPSVILIACAAAFLWIAVSTLARGRRVLADRIAFGPPLCLALWIVWLHGPLTM